MTCWHCGSKEHDTGYCHHRNKRQGSSIPANQVTIPWGEHSVTVVEELNKILALVGLEFKCVEDHNNVMESVYSLEEV